MSILKFAIMLLFCFSSLQNSCGKPIQDPKLENPDAELKESIDSEIEKENWSSLCNIELALNAMKLVLDEQVQNQLDVAKKYIVNQTGENYKKIQKACLHQNVSTSILPLTSTISTTIEETSSSTSIIM